MPPSTVNGTEFGAQEWSDSLFLRYGINPPEFLSHCDICGAAFSVCQALDCKNGGFIMECHNELHDGVADLAAKASTPARMRYDPKISTGHSVRKDKDKGKATGKVKEAPPPGEGEEKGDLLIWYIWTQGAENYSRHACCEY